MSRRSDTKRKALTVVDLLLAAALLIMLATLFSQPARSAIGIMLTAGNVR